MSMAHQTKHRLGRRQLLRNSAALAAFGLLPRMSVASAMDSAPLEPIKVLFDTDIGSDIDDAVALAYLVLRQDLQLLGITTATGEAAKRAALARAMLLDAMNQQ